ncbi:FAD-containing oxidoreductase [soil metagenome]|jgi:pyruvate/2-oxoglutarate dehydrogenase complex dihydrolipoamide dehydrogenase (E3) component
MSEGFMVENAASSEQYDVLVIGAGQAGIPLAYSLAGEGKSVALAERKHLGGSCVNFGCTPTKAAIASGEVAAQARRASEFGVNIPRVEVDLSKVLERARGIVNKKTSGIEKGLSKTENPELIWGHASIEGREDGGFRVRVGDRSVIAKDVVLDTGTRTAVPPVQGLSEIDFIHSGNWLEREELPEHLAVIGAGYIGLEMAQFYRRMGSRVTVIGSADRVAAGEDEDVSDGLRSILEAEGVEFRLGARAEKVEKAGGGASLSLDSGETIEATDVFVATGRQPNTGDLGLENAGLELPKSGIIEADERLRTSVEGLWAAGDIRGGPMFTHTAYDDFRVILSQMTGDGSHTTERVVPYAVFTDPELGRAGMTERQASESGYDYEVKSFDMAKDGKAQEIGETQGFIKVIVNRADDKILGAAVLAKSGGELVHMYVDLMNAGASYKVMRDAVHIHPTLAEAIQSAVAS